MDGNVLLNAKLTPGIILLALGVGTLFGPAQTIADGVTRDQMISLNFWLDLAAAATTSLGREFLAVAGVVGASLGLPLWQNRKGEPVAPDA